MSKEAMKKMYQILLTEPRQAVACERLEQLLREALAEQPAQQEPVGKKTRIGLVTSAGWGSLPVGTEFYTTPQAQPAQQQQEPVAWRVKWPAIGGGYKWSMVDKPLMEKEGFVNEPLYTSPPPQRTWVGLTDGDIAKEVESALEHYWNGEYIDTTGARDQLTAFARAIEAKLKEKNT